MPPHPPNTLRETEIPEFQLRGPFGGIQSETTSDSIDKLGFLDALNVIFWRSQMQTRPGYTTLTLMPNPQESIVGIADFFTSAAARRSVIMTPTRLLLWTPAGAGTWVAQAGPALTGAVTAPFSWTVVGQQLCFCQGVDQVQLWSGAGAYAPAAAAAVPAKYLAEIGNHLVVANTIEAGPVAAPQRVRWTGPGDPTDWISASAGQTDLFNDLGPINGLLKLYQSGFAFQQWGVTQVVPTGNGLKPFDFVSLSAHSKGLIFPMSLAAFGETTAAYVGKDNVYTFNGSASDPIGDRPMDGSRIRVGAQSRIFADLKQVVDQRTVFGLVTTSINGFQFNAYWLSIPNIAVWVYNFEEQNWTRFTYDKGIATLGVMLRAQALRIVDLIGPINAQTWTPLTIGTTNPFDSVLIGFNDGTPGLVDFTNYSEKAYSVTSGQMAFGDYRHNKTVNAVRIILDDEAVSTFTVTLTNERGQSLSKTVTMGSGTGVAIMHIVDLGGVLNGMYFTLKISGAAGTSISLIEATLLYTVGGEYKNV